MNILHFIASSNFITLNKTIIKKIGLEEAVLLGELASEYDYWEKANKLEDGWFFTTIENVEKNTTLSVFKQRKAIKNLKENGIIETEIRGIPAKRYIKINEKNLAKVLEIQFVNNSQTSIVEINKLDSEKLSSNNNINNNNNISCSSGDEPSSNDKLTDGENSNNEPFFEEDKSSNTSSKVNTELESDTNKSSSLRKKKEREKELKRIAESVWEEYPKKAGKTSAIKSIVQFLDGKKKINGDEYKLSFEQLLNATMDYAEEVEGRDRQFICQGSTFYNGRILDYIKEEK